MNGCLLSWGFLGVVISFFIHQSLIVGNFIEQFNFSIKFTKYYHQLCCYSRVSLNFWVCLNWFYWGVELDFSVLAITQFRFSSLVLYKNCSKNIFFWRYSVLIFFHQANSIISKLLKYDGNFVESWLLTNERWSISFFSHAHILSFFESLIKIFYSCLNLTSNLTHL